MQTSSLAEAGTLHLAGWEGGLSGGRPKATWCSAENQASAFR